MPFNIPIQRPTTRVVKFLSSKGCPVGFITVLVCSMLLAPQLGYAQGGSYAGEIGMAAATAGEQPFWLHANRHGRIDQTAANTYGRLSAQYTAAPLPRLTVQAGGEMVGRIAPEATVYFSEAYVRADYSFVRLQAGRTYDVQGRVDSRLSTGSFGVSRNAIPVPMVTLATAGYQPVPFTRGWLSVDASWSHGWLRDDRYVENPYLHQKTAHLRVGQPEGVRAYGGLIHNAMWAGTSPDEDIGRLPRSFDDYVRTVFAQSGGEEAPRGDQINVQGNSLGIWEVGLIVPLGRFRLHGYLHHPFEDRSGLRWRNEQDGLIGVSVMRNDGPHPFQRMVYEFAHTKYQSGPVHPPGQDAYYEHFTYRSGWTHHGRTIGTPLIVPFREAGQPPGIRNNRLVGHHLGVAGQVATTRYRFLLTYTRNYGTYDRAFDDVRQQYATMLEVYRPIPGTSNLSVRAALGADRGTLYEDNVGISIGVLYH